MSKTKTKQRDFAWHSTTQPLVDGKVRDFTLAAVVTEEVTEEFITDHNTKTVGNKFIATSTIETIKETTYTLGIGLSVVNPLDAAIFTFDKGKLIARGKALKPSKALLTLTSKDRIFHDDFVQNILEFQCKRITQNPDKFIKVSAPKVVQLEDLIDDLYDEIFDGPEALQKHIQKTVSNWATATSLPPTRHTK